MESNTRYFYDHGLCQTYRPTHDAEPSQPGVFKGYQFHFRYIVCDNYDNPQTETVSRMLPGGMDIFVHDATEWWTGWS